MENIFDRGDYDVFPEDVLNTNNLKKCFSIIKDTLVIQFFVVNSDYVLKKRYICQLIGMNYIKFRRKLKEQKLFSTKDLAQIWPEFNLDNLINWQDKGHIIKLRNNWYGFPDLLHSEADLNLVANRLRFPSYVSLQSALRHYNWIPESVFSVTSVTSLKPASWITPIGHFTYRSIKPSLFFGFTSIKSNEISYRIADPEKTLIDTLYFNSKLASIIDFEQMRFNQVEINAILNRNRLENYLSIISSKSLNKRIAAFHKYLEL